MTYDAPTDDLCEVIITAPEAGWLADPRSLVVDRLTASAHNLTPIRSLYEWRGQLYDRIEARAALHTWTALVPRIVQRLDAEHSYDVPGIVAMPIVASSPAYAAWVRDQTEAG